MLFPDIEPNEQGMLNVSPLHSIYWERSGNPNGLSVLIIHGGPGGGSSPSYRRYFDPKKFNICLLYTSPSPRDRTRSRMPSSA